jgi:4-hydroxybenzoate polyprenyltransferase
LAVSRADRLKTFAAFVKLEHTLFALPFAYVGMLLAERGWPGGWTFFWITLAMVGARTAAMALNRVIDAKLDARNPRTAAREIPRGVIRRREGLLLAALGFVAFGIAGYALNPLTFALLPVAVVFMVLYPYTKRFTWLCHFWLGLTIGAAAAGGWIAVSGSFAPGAVALWVAVGLWIAGFDIVYALLDEAFDRQHGVQSIPARFGSTRARTVAALCHVAALLAFALAWPLTGSGGFYALGLVVIAALLLVQHVMVARRGAALALASFNVNLYLGVAMLLAVILDVVQKP